MPDSLKSDVARTLKWNIIDRIASQVLYALTGIILANILSKPDFGIVAAAAIFQAFATLLVDGGFFYALMQKKHPTDTDYSSVMWFNIAVACALYVILYLAAPAIASLFEHDARIIPISRVLFLSMIVNAATIVQSTRLIKAMNVRMVAVSNSVGLVVSGGAGVALALAGAGAWAIVWQTLTLALVKAIILWATSSWRPTPTFSARAIRGFFAVGAGAMGSSALNVLFQNIYSFFIGNRVGLVGLAYYYQADKWSKMGISSLSQIFTPAFMPVLSRLQDDIEGYRGAVRKMNRCTAYLTFPAFLTLGLIVTPTFHALFGTKWDGAILLFQLLLVRGIFTVFGSFYNVVIIARGHSRRMFAAEVARDAVALIAVLLALPYLGWSSESQPTLGIAIFLTGQIVAGIIGWIATLHMACRGGVASAGGLVTDTLPYLALAAVCTCAAWPLGLIIDNSWLLLTAQAVVSLGLYMGMCALAGSRIQSDALAYIRRRNNSVEG